MIYKSEDHNSPLSSAVTSGRNMSLCISSHKRDVDSVDKLLSVDDCSSFTPSIIDIIFMTMQNYSKNHRRRLGEVELLVFIEFTRTESDVYFFRFGLCLSLKTAENIHLWVSYCTVNCYHSEEYNGSSYHVVCDGR